MRLGRRHLTAIAAALVVAVVAVVLLLRQGGDDTAPPIATTDPLAFVAPGADAVLDLDLRVPLVGVLFTQLLRQDAGAAVARAPLGDHAAIAIHRGGRRTLIAQLDEAYRPPPDTTERVAVRRGTLVAAPTAQDERAALTAAAAPAAARRARAAFERRLSRLPRRAGARVAFAPRVLLARFDAGLARTTWARNLRDGAAAIITQGSTVVVPLRLTSAPTRLADLPVAPGRRPPPTHGSAPVVAALRDPARTLAFARAAGLFDALDTLDRLPGFLKPDLERLGRDGTITTRDGRTVVVRLTPPDAGDWERKLGRLDALSGLARRLGFADVRIDRRGDVFRVEEGGRFALRVAVLGRTLVLTNSRTASLTAAAAAPATPPPAGAAGALTLRLSPGVVLRALDRRLATRIPRDLVRLSPVTGWLRGEPRVTAGELRVAISR